MKAKGSPLLEQSRCQLFSPRFEGCTGSLAAGSRRVMTKKRDLKRRVRERQQQTGESYVTARRHVLAARPATDGDGDDDGDDDDEPTETGIAVTVPPPEG